MAETLFRQRFIEEAKEDWEEKTIGDIFTIKGGGTPSTKEPSYWDGGIAWTSPRDLSTAKSLFYISLPNEQLLNWDYLRSVLVYYQ